MPARRRFRPYFITLAIVIGLASAPWAGRQAQATTAERAGAFLDDLTSRAIAQLTNESIPVDEREQRFRTLFRENFDVRTIGRFVLGRYWRVAKPDEREAFLAVFEDLMVRRFAPQFAGYEDTKFEISRTQALSDENQFMVTSKIVPADGKTVTVDWRIRYHDGKFKILDVIGEGVSMALTLRSEYGSVIKTAGGRVSALIAQLREVAESGGGLGTANSAAN